jgi:hypothetical protein
MLFGLSVNVFNDILTSGNKCCIFLILVESFTKVLRG